MTTEELKINITVNSDDAESKLESLRSKITEIASLSEKGNFQHLGELSKSIRSMAGSADKLSGVAQSLKAITQHAQALGSNLAGIKENKDAFNGMSRSIKSATAALEGAEKASSKGGGLFSNLGTASFGDIAGSIVSDFKRIGSAGAKVAQIPFKMLFQPMQGLATRVAGLTQGFGHLFHTIGRVAFMRAIRGAIRMVTQALKEGVGAVYDWAGAVGNGFVNTMNSITTSLTYFRNSIGAAISPILDAIAPVLDAVIDKCVAVINVFNQMIATLTGASTWRKAEKVATSFGGATNNAAKGANNANKAAKELKRTLLGFDEINRLDAPDSGSGSGGSGGGGGGGSSGAGALTFTNQPISDAVENFADMLRNAWEKGDFTEVGDLIGQKIGEALLSVPWETKIQPAVSKLATSFGTLLNGLLDYNGKGGKKMWDGIAYTVYNAINTALIGYTDFFSSVHWEGIGQGVGAALKKALMNINWNDGENSVSTALAAFPNAVIKALEGFCKEFTVEDFHLVGWRIGYTVADALLRIDWSGFFNGTFNIARRILNALNGALEGFGSKWGEIKDAILKGIKSVPSSKWLLLGQDIGRLIVNAVRFIANIVDAFVNALETADWKSIIDGIKQGIKNKINWDDARNDIGGWIVKHLGTLSLILSFIVGSTALKTTASVLRHMVMNSIVGGSGGKSLLEWAKGLTCVASLLLGISMLKNTVDKEGVDSDAFKKQLGSGIAGAIAGLAFLGLSGTGLGFLIGVTLNLDVKKVLSNVAEKVIEVKDDMMKKLPGWFKDLMGWDTDTKKSTPSELWGQATGISAPNSTTKVIESPLDKIKKTAGNIFSNVMESLSTFSIGGNVVYADQLPKTTPKTTTKPVNTGAVTNLTPPKSNVSEVFTPTGQQYKVDVTGKLVKVEDGLTDKQKTVNNGTLSVKQAIDNILAGDKSTKNWTAIYDYFKGKGVTGTTITDFIAEYIKRTGKNNALTGNKITGFVAEFIKRIQKKGVNIFSGNTISNFVAEFIKRTQKKGVNVFSGSVISGFIAQIVDRVVKWKNPLDQFIEFIAKITKKTTSSDGKGATGGIYKNGRWQPVQRYASGGLIGTSGQMFIAREAGPELVGTLGGNTAILNNDQIVSSVSNGVAKAVSAVLGGQGNNPIEVIVKVDSEVLYRSVQKGERKANGRYGTVVALG